MTQMCYIRSDENYASGERKKRWGDKKDGGKG